MKKLFFAFVTAFALVSFASCSEPTKGPNEIKAVEMFKEMGECLNLDAYKLDTLKIETLLAEAHDTTKTKFTKLAGEFDVWFGSLPGKDMEKVEKAVKEWDKKKAEIIIKAAEKVLSKDNKNNNEVNGDTVPEEETVTTTAGKEIVEEVVVAEEAVAEEAVAEEAVAVAVAEAAAVAEEAVAQQ